ncbi:MAG: NADH-quinone oxidoreductase subunit A [Actinomycetota bacterium]|nr:NADH-quinone oxidoreductase subunit A [Actinomycetota bacterium]
MALGDYLPIALMFVLAGGFAIVSVAVSYLLTVKRPTPEKLAPYECGIVPEVEPSQRYPVKFYLVAMLFVIFDIELIFLFPWAVRFRELGWYGVAAVGFFTLMLLETYVYVWKRGALDWYRPRRERYQRRQVVPPIAGTEEAA